MLTSICIHDWKRDEQILLTSNPPQYLYRCSMCSEVKSEYITTSTTIVTDSIVDSTEFKQREAVSYFSVYLNLGLWMIITALIMFMTCDKIDDLEARIEILEQR